MGRSAFGVDHGSISKMVGSLKEVKRVHQGKDATRLFLEKKGYLPKRPRTIKTK